MLSTKVLKISVGLVKNRCAAFSNQQTAVISSSSSQQPLNKVDEGKGVEKKKRRKAALTLEDIIKYQEEFDRQEYIPELPEQMPVFNPQLASKLSGDAIVQESSIQDFNLYSWNINGINSQMKKQTFQQFLKDYDPLMLCMQEIKIDSERMLETNIHNQLPTNYEQYWNYSTSKKGYAGTALLTKIKPLRVDFGIGINMHDEHGRILTAEFEKFTIVNVYSPNGLFNEESEKQQKRKMWELEFPLYLEHILEQQKKDKSVKPLIVCGDMNMGYSMFDIYDNWNGWKSISLKYLVNQNYLRNLLKRGYVDAYRHLYPTKKDFTSFSFRKKNCRELNRGLRTDYFLVSQQHQHIIKDSLMHKAQVGSDHIPIQLKFQI